MNENDKKLNENFIKIQPKSVFKTGICLFAGCQFSNKNTFNLKRHMRSCDFSPGRYAYRKRIEEVIKITELTPVNIFENVSINCNNKNSWGCPYSNKIIDKLLYFFNMKKTKDKNIVILVLKDLIYQGNLEESLKLIDNMIHIYHQGEWINNNDIEFKPTINKLKDLWYKKIRSILKHKNMLWTDRISLMQKVAQDIGEGGLYTNEHCHKLIDEVLDEQFGIERVTIID